MLFRQPEPPQGTKSAKGAAFICVLTGSPIERRYAQAEGKAGRIESRLLAAVAEGARRRAYLSPSDYLIPNADELPHATITGMREGLLNEATPTRAQITGGVCSAYGLSTWAHLFTDRQLVALSTFTDLVQEVRQIAERDAGKWGKESGIPLREGGSGSVGFGDAIGTYLGLAIDRAVMAGNTLVRWNAVGEKAQHSFGRQAFGMVWDFAEPNFLADATGSFSSCYEMAANGMLFANSTQGSITSLAAQRNGFPARPVIISTDPPYYDNIAYAELSAFFYPWLKAAVAPIWPDEFRRLTVPRDDELVASPGRHGSKSAAEEFFMQGMSSSLRAMTDASVGESVLTVYYAFKQAEVEEAGTTSAGWSSFLQAIVDSGLSIDGTWPLRTEMATRMVGMSANALASSVVLVCRKRAPEADAIIRADFIRALKREMPAAIDAIRKAGVGPVDMQQSVIGPGMGVFSRHAKVLEDDDSAMSVKTALAVINRVWEEIENELDQAFDPETQVALAWYATYGFDARASGELITLTTAKNTSDRALFASGVFKDMKGKTGLTPRDELPPGWSPATDKTLTTWECVQHTARVLNAADGGGEAAAALVAQMGPKAEEARALAYRLFEIATNKGWAAEALVYNELAQEWTKLEDRAATLDDAGQAPGPNQTTFAFDGSA